MISSLKVLALGLLICLPLTWLGFPLAYFDTAYYVFYMNAGDIQSPLIFRPLTYSLFLKLTSQPQLAVIGQSLLLAYFLHELFAFLRVSYRWIVPAVIFGVIFTPLSLYANYLLPDILSPVQVISFFLLWSSTRETSSFSSVKQWIYASAFLFTSAAHYSNLLMCLFLLGFVWKTGLHKRLTALTILPFLILPTLHWAAIGKFTFGNTANFFLMSRLASYNVLQDHLDNVCTDAESGELCLMKENGFQIWDWSEKGSIKRLGGFEEIRENVKETNKSIFTSVEHIVKIALHSLANWGRQFIKIADPLPPAMEDERVVPAIKAAFPKQEQNFLHASGKAKEIKAASDTLGLLWKISLGLALLLYFCFARPWPSREKNFFLYLLFFIVCNNLICGTLTEPMARYQDRFIWLLPVVMVAALSRKFLGNRGNHETPI